MLPVAHCCTLRWTHAASCACFAGSRCHVQICPRVHHDFESTDREFHHGPMENLGNTLLLLLESLVFQHSFLLFTSLYVSRCVATLRLCQDETWLLVSSIHIGRCSNRTLLCHILTISRQFQHKSTMSPLQSLCSTHSLHPSRAMPMKCDWSMLTILAQGLECQPPAVLHSVWVDIFGEILPPFLQMHAVWTWYADWLTNVVQSKSVEVSLSQSKWQGKLKETNMWISSYCLL